MKERIEDIRGSETGLIYHQTFVPPPADPSIESRLVPRIKGRVLGTSRRLSQTFPVVKAFSYSSSKVPALVASLPSPRYSGGQGALGGSKRDKQRRKSRHECAALKRAWRISAETELRPSFRPNAWKARP